MQARKSLDDLTIRTIIPTHVPLQPTGAESKERYQLRKKHRERPPVF